jgi:DNA-binding transcriptional LysR family regulator
MTINFEGIDWDDLRVFLHVARTNSLTQASRRLKIDHSTVSRRIAQLESSLGVAVVERQRSGLKLNSVGERLFRQAETMESALVTFQEGIESENNQASAGLVRLATMEGIASLYIAERCGRLSEIAPGVKLELVTSPQTIHVNRREADLFLSFFKPPGQGLISELIGGFRLYLYASQTYIDRFGAPESSADLPNHRFVSYIEDLIQVDSVRWLRDIIDTPMVTFYSNSMIAQMNAAAGGVGMVLLPSFAAPHAAQLIPILPDAISTTREIWLNVHSDLQFSPRIRSVRLFLTRLFGDDPSMQVMGRQTE